MAGALALIAILAYFGAHIAQAHSVDADALVGPLAGQALGQHDQPSLGRVVRALYLLGVDNHAGHGCDHKDVTALLLDHLFAHGLGNDKRRGKVNPYDFFAIRKWEVFRVTHSPDAGVIGQYVNFPVFFQHLIDYAFNLARLGDVAWVNCAFDAVFFRSRALFP